MSARDIARFGFGIYCWIRLKFACKEKSWRRVHDSFVMLIDPNDFMDRGFLFGTYEAGLCKAIRLMVRCGETCIDIGAHKGYITLHMAKAVGPSGHVFAVEPDARALQDLTANCARNGADQVESVPFLLSDRDGFCDFFLSRQLGFSSRFPNEIARPLILDVAEVKARALDRVLADAGKCEQGSLLSFVKVDAEGSEPLVLRGMSHTLERSRPLVWLEVNRSSLQSGGMGVDDVAVVLLALDYRFFRPHFWRTTTGRLRQTLIPLRKLSDESAEAFDLLAVPHGSGLEERAQVLGR